MTKSTAQRPQFVAVDVGGRLRRGFGDAGGPVEWDREAPSHGSDLDDPAPGGTQRGKQAIDHGHAADDVMP